MKKAKYYHFNAGNSTVGPIGFCAVVRANSKQEAADILNSVLPSEYEIHTGHPAIQYLNVYFGEVGYDLIDEATPVEDRQP